MRSWLVFFLVFGFTGLTVLLIIRLLRRRHAAADDISTGSGSDGRTITAAPSALARQFPDVSWTDATLFDGLASRLRSGAIGAAAAIDPSGQVFGRMTGILAELLPDSANRREETQKELWHAGFYSPHATKNLAAIRYVGIMASMLFFGTLLVTLPPRFEPVALIGLVTAPLLGWALPRLYVKGRARTRLSEIEQAMPDMIDMLNMCVSQGLPAADAMIRVSQELDMVYPELAQELRIVCEQARVGSLEQALENFAARSESTEVHSLTSLLVQTQRMGTSVSHALSEYAEGMRETLRQRTDEKANKASFRLLFPTVLCLMPAVYLFLLGPAIIELSEFFTSGGTDSLDSGSEILQRIGEQNNPR